MSPPTAHTSAQITDQLAKSRDLKNNSKALRSNTISSANPVNIPHSVVSYPKVPNNPVLHSLSSTVLSSWDGNRSYPNQSHVSATRKIYEISEHVSATDRDSVRTQVGLETSKTISLSTSEVIRSDPSSKLSNMYTKY